MSGFECRNCGVEDEEHKRIWVEASRLRAALAEAERERDTAEEQARLIDTKAMEWREAQLSAEASLAQAREGARFLLQHGGAMTVEELTSTIRALASALGRGGT